MSMFVISTDAIPEGETMSLVALLRAHDLSPATVMVRVDGKVIQKQQLETLQVARGTSVKAYLFVGGG
jgi:sulfur carrier protein ThiS